MSRTRVLLTKYAVCAGVLLIAAISGAALVAVASTRDYPVGSLVSVPGVVLSAFLVWPGALSVLGLALLVSTIFQSAVPGMAATFVVLLAMAALPDILNLVVSGVQWTLGIADCGPNGLYVPCGLRYVLLDKLRPYSYWFSEALYTGEGFVPTNFVWSATTAVLPLLGALWLFNRKAY